MTKIYKTIREKNGWTQKELAERLNISASLVRLYEKENVVPRLFYTRSFMSVFNVTWEELNE